MPQQLANVKADESSPKWESMVARQQILYQREGDLRTPFDRDYTRILHSKAFRRLKHKTQVFFATRHDHVCTRSEHVYHVASISNTIAKNLGLNADLTNAIASGHDLGHAPFGHHGEQIIKALAIENTLRRTFWHERNSLHFVDDIETLLDPKGYHTNLNLTYAVRDGIICHCGEIDEDALFPREEYIDLYTIMAPGEVKPFTWEGCVVKFSDKIAYLGRDIEDALLYKILGYSQFKELKSIVGNCLGYLSDVREVNNTVIINNLVSDLCRTSNPMTGIALSPPFYRLVQELKAFNYEHIYKYWRIEKFKEYATVVIRTIFSTLAQLSASREMKVQLDDYREAFPALAAYFENWMLKYSDYNLEKREMSKFRNNVIYTIGDSVSYLNAVLDFISSMTDQFAIKVFDEIISF